MIAKGRREGRAPAGTRVRAQWNAHGMDYRSRRSPGLPCADGFNGVLRALPGERCTVAPVASAALSMCAPGRAAASPKGLTPATGRQDHTTSAVRGRPGLSAGARCAHHRRIEAGVCSHPMVDRAAVTIAVSSRVAHDSTALPPLSPPCRAGAAASTAPRPASRDDREAPLWQGRDGRNMPQIRNSEKRYIFAARD